MELEILPSEANVMLTNYEQNSLINLFNALRERVEEYLKNYINETISEVFENHLGSQEQEEEYLTIDETCKLLKISRPTLHRWSEGGKVKKHYLYGNPRYLKTELLPLVKSIETKR